MTLLPEHQVLSQLERHDLSDPALAILAANDSDPRAVGALVERHALAMTRFEQAVGMAVTARPAERVVRLASVSDLPIRAAWLQERASDRVADEEDAFLFDRFLELSLAWRTALWHAEVEGEAPLGIGRLLAIGAAEAVRTVRSAHQRLLWSITASTPAGMSQACMETSAVLCSSACDSRAILTAAAEHGRTCDECMLLVRRVILFASDLRASLLRTVAGELGTAYDAARPPAFRPRARVDVLDAVTRRTRPALLAAAMGGAAALAVGALAIGPAVIGPVLPLTPSAQAAVAPGTRLAPMASADLTSSAHVGSAFTPADLSPVLAQAGRDPQPNQSGDRGGKDAQFGSSELGQGGTPEPDGEAPDPTTTPGPGEDDPTAGDQGTPAIPTVQVGVGPVTVDTSGDGPLITVDDVTLPEQVEAPALPAGTDEVDDVVVGLVK